MAAATSLVLLSTSEAQCLLERQRAAESSAEAAIAAAEELRAAHQQVQAASSASAQAAAEELAAAKEQAAARLRSLQLTCNDLEGQLGAARAERAAAVAEAGDLRLQLQSLQGGQASTCGEL